MSEIDAWYRRTLLKAPTELLQPSELREEIFFMAERAADGSSVVSLPANVLRVVEVRLRSWLRPAKIVNEPSEREILRQLHPYTRATRSLPVAFARGGELRLYPGATDTTDGLVTLKALCLKEGEYIFDSTLLTEIHPL